MQFTRNLEVLRQVDPRFLIAQLAISVAYTIFIVEITQLVGYNHLRILYSIGTFTCVSLLILGLIRMAWARIALTITLVVLLWGNLIHFRYFGTTLQLGEIYNIGFLPILGSQILVLMRFEDIWLLATVMGIVYGFRHNLLPTHKLSVNASLSLTAVYFSMVLFQFVILTEPHMKIVRETGESESRLEYYRSVRFEAQDHAGSILQFGLGWRYFVDYLQLRGGRDLEQIPADQLPSYPSNMAKPNIIVIQVEALDRAIINFEYNGHAVTPFLNKLAQNSDLFSGVYAQHSSGGGTSDGDFSFLTSLYPLGSKGSLGAVGLTYLPTLPRMLGSIGYTTIGAHGNSGSYFYRERAYRQLGFEQWFFKEQFEEAEPDRWHGLKDRDFFEQMADVLAITTEPFFAFLVTLSSHSPFDRLSPGDYEHNFDHPDQLAANYFGSMHYLDSALEQFWQQITETHPESVLLIYGDHGSNLQTTGYDVLLPSRLEPITVIYADPHQIGSRTVSTIGSTIDLAPTLLDILGFERPQFWQGLSLVDEQRTSPALFVGSNHIVQPNGDHEQVAIGDSLFTPLFRTKRYLR